MSPNNFVLQGIIILFTFIFLNKAVAQNPITIPTPQDIEVTAQVFTYDNTKGIALYEGKVVAIQGDRKLTGDKLEIYRAPDTGEIDKLIIWGNLAKYQGRTEKDQSILTAVAKKITYLPKTEYFILEEQAEISQNNEFYRAPRMEYDARLQKMYSPNSNQGHTSIMLKNSLD